MTRSGKAAVLACAFSFATACTPAKKVPVDTVPPIDWTARLAEADTLYAAGHYTALRDAKRIYGEALTGAPEKAGIAEKLIRTAIASDLRKKDLGVLSAGPPVDLDPLAAAEPALFRYAPWLELLAELPNRIKGSPGIEGSGGRSLEAHLDWVSTRVPAIEADLERSAGIDDLAAAHPAFAEKAAELIRIIQDR